MKTRILKLGMPIVTFFLAIAFAFATENNAFEKEAFITGYIHEDGLCKSVQVDCENRGSIQCTSSSGVQVYTNNTCLNKMFRLQ